MSAPRHWDQDKDSTLYIGNLDERCTDPIIWEFMLQAGPIINVHLPKDRVTQSHQGYGFVEFASEDDADYAAKIMNQIRLYGKPIRVNKATADKRGVGGAAGADGAGQGVGAELFVGNLDGMVDEKVLFETFSRFGPLVAPPKITRDDSNLSKGYGFISYASFDASDDAIANMHGQYLMNKEVTVQYAYKKDGKGERHGDAAERALAAQAKKHGVQVAIPAMPASLVGAPNVPTAPSVMNGTYGAANQGATMQPPQQVYPPSYGNYGQYGYNNMPPPPPQAVYASATPQGSWYPPQQQQWSPATGGYSGGQPGYASAPAYPPQQTTPTGGYYPPTTGAYQAQPGYAATAGGGGYQQSPTYQQPAQQKSAGQGYQPQPGSTNYQSTSTHRTASPSQSSSSAYQAPSTYSVPPSGKTAKTYNDAPIQAPPDAGLPARPPPSQAGYGGPPGMERVVARGGMMGQAGKSGRGKGRGTGKDGDEDGPKYED